MEAKVKAGFTDLDFCARHDRAGSEPLAQAALESTALPLFVAREAAADQQQPVHVLAVRVDTKTVVQRA